MDYLSEHHYRVAPLEEIVNGVIHSQKVNRKTLAITFDDGYEDHFLYAYPVLEKYSFPATIFLTVNRINGYWESEKALGGKIKGLSRDQILEMQNAGLIQFGSHGYSHNSLLAANEEEQSIEIRGSKLYLEDLLSEDVPFISYPFGACDDGVKNIVKEAGYQAGFTIWNRKPDIYSIPRIPLHTHDGSRRFRFKISPFYYPAKSFFRFV
ncbi:MAG: polysaccharide deacetylase family protein [Candidatus Aenigmarchaeota archaeon]|nr:polysaccharide deacetylase family protein [Candidatus Aenigmarchaeota archaeon]